MNSTPVSKSRALILWIAVPLLLLLAGTAATWIWDIDRECCRFLFAAKPEGGGEWKWRDAPLWKGLYYYGTMPALAAGLLALTALALSFIKPGWEKYRRVSLYALLLLGIGPGVVTNAILKDHWGRPRPAMVDEFGGEYPFEPVLHVDPASPGKSFPCGHATMGFFFFAGYFIFRRQSPLTSRLFLILALVLGGLIGAARMAQGGHFFSDVIWACAVMWLVALGLARLLGLPEKAFLPPAVKAENGARTRPRWFPLAVGFGVTLLLFLFALATPYGEKQQWEASQAWNSAPQRNMKLVLAAGSLRILPGETFSITHSANGFGLPGSALKESLSESTGEKGARILSWRQRKSGLFSELEASTVVTLSPNSPLSAELEIQGEGPFTIELPGKLQASQSWTIHAPDRKLVLKRPPGIAFLQDMNKFTFRNAESESSSEFILTLKSGSLDVKEAR